MSTERSIALRPRDRAQSLTDRLSATLGLAPVRVAHRSAGGTSPWAASGLMALTGCGDVCVSPSMDVIEGADALMRAAQAFGCPALGFELLTERAALSQLRPRGQVSCGGASRLLACADGWIALTLARADDFDMAAALLGGTPIEPWTEVAEAARASAALAFVERAQLLSLAAAVVDVHRRGDDVQWRSRGAIDGPHLRRLGAAGTRKKRPLVVDLSALWAGPLCGALLGQTGARVIKVESTMRPDGARRGDTRFYDLLNAGKEAFALDFSNPADLAALRRLIQNADVVIESARPRAFAHLGLAPEDMFAINPALTWISVTAYGRTGPWRNRAGYGDDAAAGAGLVAWDDAGSPVFIGDAIADPLTGIAAAAGAFASLQAGGGWLVDASLRETAAFVARSSPLQAARGDAAPPRTRLAGARAADLGRDTARLYAEFG